MDETPTLTDRPVILFDGVCNLCSTAARWVIERDRRGAFRFASLQSEAARGLIADRAPGVAIPDSVVLVDGEGVHTRSSAALRIARRLGFPWSMLAVAAIVPTVIRDRVYDWIARNRYRWFGRQNACLAPTPELRERFLDANEPVCVVEPATSAVALVDDGPRTLVGLWARLLHRVVIVFLFLNVFPFPIGAIPYTEKPAEVYSEWQKSSVVWVAKSVFGIEITVFPGGSGDTTYNYIELFTNATIALSIGILWTLAARGRTVGAWCRDRFSIYVRYYLATVLLGYGWHKVMPIQMPFPGPDRLIGTIGDMSPMGLLWTLLGASPAYQIFAGLGEVIGGGLLLWRRTTVAGALVSAAVMTNVVAMNFCYDVPVKLYSSALLLMALYLAAPHLVRLAAVVVLNLPAQPVVLRPFPIRWRWLRWTACMVKTAYVGLVMIVPVYMNYQYLKSDGLLAPTKPWHGIYRVESFVRDGVADRALEDADRWVRVGINGMGIGAIQRADGSSKRQMMTVDEAKSTMTIKRRDEPEPMVLSFSMPEAGVVKLEGPFEGGQISATLRRTEDVKPLLTTRGFHWINEFPLNR